MEYLIRGESLLYGTVEKVDGQECELRAANEVITCQIATNLANELKNYLHRWVCVIGQATWNSHCEIVSFAITDLNRDYQDKPLNQAFSKLAKKIGQYYDGIDPVAYVQTCREE